ncbi:MAG TPA: DUF4339 domain-containing protein [Gemmataceae bacterium]|jgi:hypothetical protein|nr:DUF4339 domain-containing protein [Gemmataceae bacterium]
MAERWYYTRNGQTHGPYTTAEIKQLALAGVLHSSDLLWPEGTEPQVDLVALPSVALPAGPPPASPSGPRPDWLSDVEETAKPKPPARPKPSEESAPLPDWLDDVRQREEP